jgi:hypothetical protein
LSTDYTEDFSPNIAQTLIEIMLDDPDMRAVFERVLGEAQAETQAFPGPADRPVDRPFKSGTCLSRLSTIEEKITEYQGDQPLGRISMNHRRL